MAGYAPVSIVETLEGESSAYYSVHLDTLRHAFYERFTAG